MYFETNKSIGRLSGAIVAALVMSVVMVSCGDDDEPPNGPDPVPGNSVISVNGNYFKGVMGSDSLDRDLTFAVTDSLGNKLPSRTIEFELVEGDGTRSATSLATTTADSTATVDYTFDGVRGDAVIRVIAPDVDTIEVELRANTIIGSSNPQGQYLFTSETFQDVVNYNGDPASLDVFPGIAGQENFAYANYENELAFVAALWKEANEDFVRDTSSIRALLLTANYPYKTADSIGIGSSYHQDIQPALGDAPIIVPDPNFPGDIVIQYGTLGYQFYASETDSVVVEIHMIDPITPPAKTDEVSGLELPVPFLPRWQQLKSALEHE